jgi:hypothetical protein
MTLDDSPELNAAEDICTVCGRNAIESNQTLSHLRHEGEIVAICCPQCMETFQREPARFAAKECERRLSRATVPEPAARSLP